MRFGVIRACWFGFGLLTLVLSVTGTLQAGGSISVPEIDGSSIPMALGILSAGVLLLRARRAK